MSRGAQLRGNYASAHLARHTGLLRSDDRHARIKKDEQQHEAAHKYPEAHTHQRLPEPLGPHDARGAYRTVTSAITSPIHVTALAARSMAVI
jgi:hypothetical protein